jgi:predicted phosphoribosyltransferase
MASWARIAGKIWRTLMSRRFRDRADAGRVLGSLLSAWSDRPDVLVLGLPRGGVPVAAEVAAALRAPFDVFLVRKLGVPGHEELAMGAIASGGVRVLNHDVIQQINIPDEILERVTRVEQQELERRERAYRDARPPPVVRDRVIILVDDGLATGSTMRAAIRSLRLQHPARIVVAVPTGAPQICEEIGREADDAICAISPEPFYAVGLWYEDFSETTDDDVRALLARREETAAFVNREAPVGEELRDAGPLKQG